VWRFGETYRLHLQGRRVRQAEISRSRQLVPCACWFLATLPLPWWKRMSPNYTALYPTTLFSSVTASLFIGSLVQHWSASKRLVGQWGNNQTAQAISLKASFYVPVADWRRRQWPMNGLHGGRTCTAIPFSSVIMSHVCIGTSPWRAQSWSLNIIQHPLLQGNNESCVLVPHPGEHRAGFWTSFSILPRTGNNRHWNVWA
jgi:hypothetical protein